MEGPRAACLDELDAVVALSNTVFGEHSPHDMGRWFPTLFRRENLEHLRIFSDEGRPVALAGFTVDRLFVPGASFVVGCVGSVCTLGSHRGRGLGTRLVDDCASVARAEGAAALLVSGGRGLYRRMGCIDAGRYLTMKVPRGAAPTMRTAGERRRVREWRIADIPRMTELYRAEPVRFERTEDDFFAYLRTGRVTDRACRTWVVCPADDAARVDAYLCVQEAGDGPEGRVVSVQEFAGPRDFMIQSLNLIMVEMKADRAAVDCLGSDLEMSRLATAHGFEAVPRGFLGTVKVIDPPRLLPVLKRFAGPAVTCRASTEGFTMLLGLESYEVRGPESVTAFLFGSSERQPDLPGPGPLCSALQDGLPVPLPDYGLNYI
jgi:GNAT superfamily N-acetyltransferase